MLLVWAGSHGNTGRVQETEVLERGQSIEGGAMGSWARADTASGRVKAPVCTTLEKGQMWMQGHVALAWRVVGTVGHSFCCLTRDGK